MVRVYGSKQGTANINYVLKINIENLTYDPLKLRKILRGSKIINKQSVIHQGLLNEAEIDKNKRGDVYFRYDEENELIYALIVDNLSMAHSHLKTIKLRAGHKRGLETERRYFPVLISHYNRFIRYEKDIAFRRLLQKVLEEN